MNAAEMTLQMLAARSSIDDAFDEYHAAIVQHAEKNKAAKLAKATAYVTIKTQIEGRPTVAEIEARVDKATLGEQFELDLASGRLKAAHLGVQYRMGVLSSLQSLSSLTKAEAQLANFSPREVESA